MHGQIRQEILPHNMWKLRDDTERKPFPRA